MDREKANSKSGSRKETEEEGSGQTAAGFDEKARKDTEVTEDSMERKPLTTNVDKAPLKLDRCLKQRKRALMGKMNQKMKFIILYLLIFQKEHQER